MNFSLFVSKKFINSKQSGNFFSLISLITISGIALGVAVLIITLTILDGFEKTVAKKILDFNSHINISGFHRNNLPPLQTMNKFFNKNIKNSAKSISPFIAKTVLIKSGNFTEGIILNGIDPQNDNSRISQYIIEGEYSFLSDNFEKIIVGKKLADKMNIKTGNKITVFSLKNDKLPSYENPPAIEQFTVAGIYESGMADYDDLTAYCHINTANSFFDMNGLISGYNIQLKKINEIDSVANFLSDKLPYPFYVRSFTKMHPQIFTWLDLQKKPIPIILGLITLVAVFNIIGTLLMMVLEKTRQIGILKTLGAKKINISSIFIYQGMFLAVIGVFSGNVLAFVLSYLQKSFNIISLPESVYFISSVPININIYHYLLIDSITIFLAFLATFIPSRYAAKTNPISSIKFN